MKVANARPTTPTSNPDVARIFPIIAISLKFKTANIARIDENYYYL
jgi:hypothetical protein